MALVQTKTASDTDGTVSVSFDTLPTVGHAVIVLVGNRGFGNTSGIDATDVADNQGNTYNRHVTSLSGSWGNCAAVFSCLNTPTASGTFTVTLTGNGADGSFITIIEDDDTGLVFDVSAHGQNDTDGNNTTGNLSGTTAQATELEVAVTCSNLGGITVDTLSPAYTQIAESSIGGAYESDYRELTATTNVGCSWTQPNATFYSSAAATFKRTVAGATREQEGYRFRADDGSESTATWLASQDTNISRAKSVNTRLRLLTNVTGDAPSEGLKLQYRRANGADEWKDVD